ncbi:efflux transporter outer membrane subunit [Campylobacterota bacterium DY0563]
MRNLVLIFISLYILTGCVPKVEKIKKFDNSKINKELKTDLNKFKSSQLSLNTQWWKNFKDEQLNSLINEALNNAPTLKILKTRYKSAQSIVEINKALKKPSIGVDGNVSRQRYSQNYIFPDPLGGGYYNLYDQGLGLNYDFDFWDKNSSLIKASINKSLAQKLYIQVKKIAMTTSIVKLYATLNYKKKQLEKIKVLEKNIEEKHHILNTLHELGLANQIEINRSSTSLEKVKQNSLDLKIEIEDLKKSLSIVSGLMPSKIEKLKRVSTFDKYKVFVPKDIHLDVLSHRPDIAIQKYLLLSRDEYITNAKAQFYPNISISGLLGFTSFSWASLFDKSSYAPYIGSAISLPLFDGNRRENNLNIKTDDYNIQVQEYNQSVIKAINEVVASLKKFELNKSKIKVQNNILKSKEKNLVIEKKIFNLGLKNKISYIDSKLSLIDEEITKLSLKNNELNAQIDLIKALGGGYKEKGKTLDNN